MAGGKHAARSKSFEDLEFYRKERSRRKEEIEEKELDDKLEVHNNILDSNANEYDDNYGDEYDDWDESPEINYKKIAIVVIIVIAIVTLIFGVYKFLSSKNDENELNKEETSQVDEAMPSSISGYKVLGQVIIKNLNVEQYILNLPEDEALKSGVVKLYGNSLNGHGNFCIAGHNYEGVFKDLEKVNVGDEIIIKDTRNVEYKYKVTSVKNVEPDNLECLIQDTSKVEITLITCDTGGTSRVVVKAEQVAKDNG